MSRKTGLLQPLLIAAAGATAAMAFAPTAGADPVRPRAGDRDAAATIDDLQDQGYNVEIDWVRGYSTEPLKDCEVRAIRKPVGARDRPPEETTLYVDVSCPHRDDDWDWDLGVGIGF
jgi:hypothetical protein